MESPNRTISASGGHERLHFVSDICLEVKLMVLPFSCDCEEETGMVMG